jgi:hypothetical protein
MLNEIDQTQLAFVAAQKIGEARLRRILVEE